DARGLLNVPSNEAETNQISPNILEQSAKGGSIAVPIPTTAAVIQQADARFLQTNFAEHSTMDQLATETGGKAFYNTNAVGEAIVKSIADGANYYTIGYIPDNTHYNGAFRNVDIAVP